MDNKNNLNQTSTSVENALDFLGNTILIIGIILGFILIFYGIAQDFIFSFSYGAALLFSSLVSGYLLKGVAKIITLLSQSLQASSTNKVSNIETDNADIDKTEVGEDFSSELIDDDFRDELIDKRSLSELKNKFDELNSINWNYMTKAQKDLREKIVKKIQSSYNS